MAKFKSAAYLDGGPDLLRTRAATTGRLQVHLLSSYSAGQNYATCLGNSLGSVNLVPGDITTAAGTDYLLRCQVDAPDGSRYVLAGVLPVRTA